MPYCSQCGVEVDNGVTSCPLCAFPVPVLRDSYLESSRYPTRGEMLDDRLPPGARRWGFWKALTFALVLCLTITVASDLLRNGGITWSMLTLIIFVQIWAAVSWGLLLIKHPGWMLLGWALMSAGFLALYDLLYPPFYWYLTLGLPVLGMAWLFSSSLVWLWRWRGFRGFGFLAWMLMGIVICSLGLDLLIKGHQGLEGLGWSLMVLATGMPLVGFCFYIHYRVARRVDLRKIFHA